MSRLKEIKGEIKALKLERELLRNKKTEHPLIVEARKRGFYEGMKEHFICLRHTLLVVPSTFAFYVLT